MRCETPDPGPRCPRGRSSSFREHSARANPAEALPGLDDAVVPVLFHPVPPPMPTHGRVESGNPLLLPHTHTAERGAQQNPGREERPTLIHPPKESGGRTISSTAPRCRRAKSTDLCAPGQLCWHRRSLGNVRRLKIEQMFLLKGLLQCSA